MLRTSGNSSALATSATRSQSRIGAAAATSMGCSNQADIEGNRAAHRACDGRPLDGVSEQAGKGFAIGAAFELRPHPDGGEAHRLGTDMPGAPDRGDVQVAFQL